MNKKLDDLFKLFRVLVLKFCFFLFFCVCLSKVRIQKIIVKKLHFEGGKRQGGKTKYRKIKQYNSVPLWGLKKAKICFFFGCLLSSVTIWRKRRGTLRFICMGKLKHSPYKVSTLGITGSQLTMERTNTHSVIEQNLTEKRNQS